MRNRAQYIIQQIEEVMPVFDKAAMSPRAIGTTVPREPGQRTPTKLPPQPTHQQSDAAMRQERQDKKSAMDWSGVYSR